MALSEQSGMGNRREQVQGALFFSYVGTSALSGIQVRLEGLDH
jgi:hypothetical protein